jgi:hypothetical protein
MLEGMGARERGERESARETFLKESFSGLFKELLIHIFSKAFSGFLKRFFSKKHLTRGWGQRPNALCIGLCHRALSRKHSVNLSFFVICSRRGHSLDL